MDWAVVIAGFGGQGVLFAGRVLAQAAMDEGREVLWIPSYGPEMRGGTAACTVILGDGPVGSPIVDRYDAAVALNPPSLVKYAPRVAAGGVLVVNSTLVPDPSGRTDVDEIRVACSAIAREAGDDLLVSVVALGALVARLPMVGLASIHVAIEQIVGEKRPDALQADLAAFDLGLEWGARPRAGLSGEASSKAVASDR